MSWRLAAALLMGCAAANAQPAPSSAAKRDLIQRVLVLQQPALESLIRSMAEQPARQLMADTALILQSRVAPEKRDAAAKQIEAGARQYQDDVSQLAKDQAPKVGRTSLAPALDQKFNEEELRQLLAALEAPAYKKFQHTLPDLTVTFTQKAAADLRPTIEPKLKALEQGIVAALGLPLSPAANASSGAASAPAPTSSPGQTAKSAALPATRALQK